MHDRTAKLLAAALLRFDAAGGEDAAAFLIAARDRPAARAPRDGCVSRQAQHQRFFRTKYRAIASAYLLMPDNPDLENLAFDPDFARLRPSAAALHTRINHLAAEHIPTAASLARGWERLVPRFIDYLGRIPTMGTDHLLCFHSAFQALNVATMYRPRDFEPAWRDLWRDLGRRGLLENPYVKVWMTMLGSYAGRPEAQVEILMDANMRAMDLLDGLLFARHDCSESTLHAVGALVRGGAIRPEECHAGLIDLPRSAWLQLGAYVRACVRMPTHNNQGLIMMLLSWVAQMAGTGLVLARHDGTAADVARLVGTLRKIEAVQILEKSRFWRIVDAIPEAAPREVMTSMWYASVG